MAFRLEKPKTTSTPYIFIDEEQGYMKIEGRSFHENIIEFFSDIDNWLDGYLLTNFGVFTFDCMMDYFNSSTVKALLNMISKMDKYSVNGNNVIVNWITMEGNEIIIEIGEDFKEDIQNLTFNMVVN